MGRWSIGFAIGLILSFVLFQLLVVYRQHGGDAFFSNLALKITILLTGI